MATGRRNTPLVRPYEQRTVPSGVYGARASGVHMDDTLARAIADAGNTVMRMQAEQQEQKMDQYDLWLEDERKKSDGLLKATADPAEKDKIRKEFEENANAYGKELLGEEGLGRWADSPKHGYNYWNRYQYATEVSKAADAYNQGRQLAVSNAGKYAQLAMGAKDPEEQKSYMEKANSILSNKAYFTEPEMQKNKADVWKTAATDHFYSTLGTDPAEAIKMTKEDWFRQAIGDSKELNGMYNQAQEKSMGVYYEKRIDGVVGQQRRTNGIAKRIMAGEEVPQSEIDANVPAGIDRDIVYKMAHLTKGADGSSGSGRAEYDLLTGVNLQKEFELLLKKKETYELGRISDRKLREDNEQYLSEVGNFRNAVIEAYSNGSISREKATTYLTSTDLAVYDKSVADAKRVATGRPLSKEPNVFSTGLSQMNGLLDDYSIKSPVMREQVTTNFLSALNTQLEKNNLSAETFANASPQVKDQIMKLAQEEAMRDVVNMTPFANIKMDIPASMQGNAESRYMIKVFQAKQQGRFPNRYVGAAEKSDEKAMQQYLEAKKKDDDMLSELAKQSYEEEISEVQRAGRALLAQGESAKGEDYMTYADTLASRLNAELTKDQLQQEASDIRDKYRPIEFLKKAVAFANLINPSTFAIGKYMFDEAKREEEEWQD